jgi:hypothetical protein
LLDCFLEGRIDFHTKSCSHPPDLIGRQGSIYQKRLFF